MDLLTYLPQDGIAIICHDNPSHRIHEHLQTQIASLKYSAHKYGSINFPLVGEFYRMKYSNFH